MGHQTSLPIKSIYAQRPPQWTRRLSIVLFDLIDFNHVIWLEAGEFCRVRSREEWAQICLEHPEYKRIETHRIRFGSHMRDFEVVPGKNLTLARGQGIGVIIDFTRDVYLKLWYDRKETAGFTLYLTGWAHTHSKAIPKKIGTDSDPTLPILHSDLSNGWDIYIIDYKGQGKNWCEPRTAADEQATPIIFSTFQKYAQYDPEAKSEVKSDSDGSESEPESDSDQNKSEDDSSSEISSDEVPLEAESKLDSDGSESYPESNLDSDSDQNKSEDDSSSEISSDELPLEADGSEVIIIDSDTPEATPSDPNPPPQSETSVPVPITKLRVIRTPS